ncbi:MAG: outer membrane beta-barrel protein [Acidobacteria bacterium]|jgi:outer membrane protein W|nr:outer membrane beta-barrel protein [Acidobacteriota bacterium]
MKLPLALIAVLALVAPAASAQDEPDLAIRPFVLGTIQGFSAVDSFNAVFGKSYEPFFGGGVQVVFHEQFFVELAASRFKQTGERAFISNGQSFQLGIPLTATLTPFEVTAGYRFKVSPRVRPYIAAGAGTYQYKETSSFNEAGEDVDVRHAGFVLNGGADFRLHPWIRVGADVQYTHVPGILGTAGVSAQASEDDLGGVAARFKLIVGR